jgi:16S rRNA (guanine527-N7)-methyltransferase
VHGDAAVEQWRGQFIQRPVALNVAQKHRRPRRGRQRRETGVDEMPMLVNVADKNNGHAVPGCACRGYHGGMVTVRQQLDPPVRAALDAYEALLRKWNATINLVSAADVPLLWPRHIEDSLQLGSIAGPLPPRAIDFGSGAGFPGLILAIAFGIEVELIEQDQRKAAFLREAVMVTGARARVHAMKIERVTLPPAPLIVCRALATLPVLLGWAKPLLTDDGFCLFAKTAAAEPEIAKAQRHWSMRIDRIPSRTDPNGVILRVSELRPIA